MWREIEKSLIEFLQKEKCQIEEFRGQRFLLSIPDDNSIDLRALSEHIACDLQRASK
jgi:hypothetical protein